MTGSDLERLQDAHRRLHVFCAQADWRGYDPYDGLASPVVRFLPFSGRKIVRQAWTQLHRRSPLNLRPLVGIRPADNPKGLALFARGTGDRTFLDRLRRLETPEGGWGYPFPWQSRAFYAPGGIPNLICTAYVARAFRDHGETCDVSFVEKQLLREAGGERWITYVSPSRTQVHNVNMIGAALLGRRDCMEFSVRRQREDGSWWYGEAPNQRWIDSFHTAFNLEALADYREETGDDGFAESERRGYDYWDRTFWEPDGAPRYHHDRAAPRDLHCSAQGILTYLRFGAVEKADRAAAWALDNMWDERGFFWYQRGRWITNRLCYMRWTQAWMYLALARLIRVHTPPP